MNSLEKIAAARLAALREQGLARVLRRVDSPQGREIQIDGKTFLNFSSNDYLGLANSPALRAAARAAIEQFGVGAGSARLLSGSFGPHEDLEKLLAEFKGTEAALTFSSGYAAACGAVVALMTADDVVILDRRVHACCVDAARLSGAKIRVFHHNDPESLEKILRWANQWRTSAAGGKNGRNVLVVTESVFSMDGDLAPLREIIELKDRYDAWLMLDEAHATGLFGEKRRGLAEAQELADRVDVHMSTLGKAVGAAGGVIAGSQSVIGLLQHRARSFLFSTAPLPAAAAAAAAGVKVIQSPEGELRRALLWDRVDQLKNALIQAGWPLGPVQSPIIPLPIGSEHQAVAIAAALSAKGIFVPAIRYPTVARNEARLRLTVTSEHTREDLERVAVALAEVKGPSQSS